MEGAATTWLAWRWWRSFLSPQDHIHILTTDSDHETQYMAPEDADRYECLVAQRVLSVQVTQAEQNQRHNLFHTKGVVKERSVRVIIDGGSCNNLASMEMVEKLSLTTRPHPHPYYIQWFNNSGKVKVTRTVRVHFSISTYADYVDCDVVPQKWQG